jgi:hypothetical protein
LAYADEIPKLKKDPTKLSENNYDGFVSIGYEINSGKRGY